MATCFVVNKSDQRNDRRSGGLIKTVSKSMILGCWLDRRVGTVREMSEIKWLLEAPLR
jgi:hypothetical protein